MKKSGSIDLELLFFFFFFSDWDDVKPIEILGVTGKNAQIMCFYSDSHKDKDKFLCKGGNPFNCEELINKRKEDSGGRFTIRDNLRLKYFYVYIKNLSIADSGTYWCSDKTFQHAGYTKIHLSVGEYTDTLVLLYSVTQV